MWFQIYISTFICIILSFHCVQSIRALRFSSNSSQFVLYRRFFKLFSWRVAERNKERPEWIYLRLFIQALSLPAIVPLFQKFPPVIPLRMERLSVNPNNGIPRSSHTQNRWPKSYTYIFLGAIIPDSLDNYFEFSANERKGTFRIWSTCLRSLTTCPTSQTFPRLSPKGLRS